MTRKLLFVSVIVLLVSVLSFTVVSAQKPNQPPQETLVGTGFTYQGQLKNNGNPVNGTCDFQFSLWDAAGSGTPPSGGNQLGSPQTFSGVHAVTVANGLFTVLLNSAGQFGANPFKGDARWLQIAVSCPSGGTLTTLSPRQQLTPVPYALALPGLWTEQNATSPNIIGGYSGNSVTGGAYGVTIGGGGAGGTINTASANYATIGGGASNNADNQYATIGGGSSNTASGVVSTVGGGQSNTASNQYATIGGGRSNTASGAGAFIGGGGYDGTSTGSNVAAGNASTIGGGISNTIQVTGTYATIGGGESNTASGYMSTVGGGWSNTASGSDATIGGGVNNTASGVVSTVGGGAGNTVSGWDATVGGGYHNTASNQYATIGGGYYNTASGVGAFIGGGGYDGTSTGGNVAAGNASTIGGGISNTIQVAGTYATIGGGKSNTASNMYPTIGGGYSNVALGNYATVPGGANNTANGDLSLAAGYRAKANHNGAFVWADSINVDFASTNINQFDVRASGGFYFYPASGYCYLGNGSAGWSCSSDRALKENFQTLDTRQVLERVSQMPITQWNSKGQDATIQHIGPMAQDFYAAFGLGDDNTHISTTDAQGVALAAIQGLYEVVQQKDAQIAAQQQQIAVLESRMTALEQAARAKSNPIALPDGLSAPVWVLVGLVGCAVWQRARRGGER